MQQPFRLTVLLVLLGLAGACADGRSGPSDMATGWAASSGPARPYQIAQATVAPAPGEPEDEDLEDEGFSDLFPDDGGTDFEPDFDPIEPVNRFVFAINETLDIFILRPAAETYRFLLPEVVRDSVRNFLRNLKTPVLFLNHLWQGKEEQASDILVRFGINTTLGLGGLIDVAAMWGYEYRSEDFGQTLGVYGVEPGPYLVLPLFGPSSLRDAFGRGVDSAIDPLSYVLQYADVERDTEILLGRAALEGLDTRSRNIENLDELKRDSVDFYARVRSLYLQFRDAEIRDGETPGGESLDSQ